MNPPVCWLVKYEEFEGSSCSMGARPRFSAPITLVVIPDECQSIPITAPKDWNQNGFDKRRNTSVRPYSSGI